MSIFGCFKGADRQLAGTGTASKKLGNDRQATWMDQKSFIEA
jgi:hypothetical protein